MASLREGQWLHDAAASLYGEIIPVAYKHHLTRDEIAPGRFVNLMKYKAWQLNHEPKDAALNWGEHFRQSAELARKIIVAKIDWDHALVYDIVRLDCRGPEIDIILADPFSEMIRLKRDAHRKVWTPYLYTTTDTNGDLAAARSLRRG